jgi:hypothetical protein
MWEDDGMRDQGVPDSEGTGEGKANSDSTDDSTQEEKKSNKKRGMLAWFKIRVGPSYVLPLVQTSQILNFGVDCPG